jgi:selenocysteine-specific elongation factor
MDEALALVEGTTLRDAPAFALSATTGEGVEALKTWLFDAARTLPPHAGAEAAFRLAIDRAFTLDGVGTVVTGTVHAGRVRVDDELVLVPGGRRVRVRSLHAQNRAVACAQAGERCAAALAGVGRDEIARGQWLAAPAAALAAERVDARVRVWPAEGRALRSGLRVQAHLGAAAVEASVAVLDGDAIAPGASGRVQLVLHRPAGAWMGDRVVLRDASATRTIAGGTVIDPFGPARYRRTPQRQRELEALARRDAGALVAVAPHGVDLERFAAADGRPVPEAGLPEGTLRAPPYALGAAQARAAAESACAALAAFHERAPDEPGPDAARLRRLAAPRLPEPLWRVLLASLQAAGRVAAMGSFVHLPEHGVRLSATEQRIAEKVAPLLVAAGSEGAWVRDLARDTHEAEALMRMTLARLARRGEMHQVVKDLYFAPAALAALATTAREAAADDGAVSAAAFRDASRLGRKRAIQVLEFFDRVGLLRRVGDVHRVRVDSHLFEQSG